MFFQKGIKLQIFPRSGRSVFAQPEASNKIAMVDFEGPTTALYEKATSSSRLGKSFFIFSLNDRLIEL